MVGATTNVEVVAVSALIVDDHPLFRMGLSELLRLEPGVRVEAAVGSAAEAIEIANARPIGIALIDVLLPGTSGIELTKWIKRVQPACKILGLSALGEPLKIAEMFRAGADGFMTKGQPAEQLVDAIVKVMRADRYLPPGLDAAEIETLAHSDSKWPLERLTAREREVFNWLVVGETNDDIGTRLCISRRTVETHRQNLMRKLAARSMVDLVRLAVRFGG